MLLLAVVDGPRAAVALDDGQVWWGHYTEDQSVAGIGQEKAYNYNCAIYISGSDATVGGCAVSAVRFPLLYRTSNMRSAKVWIGSRLPAAGEQPDMAEVSILDAKLQGRTESNVAFNEVKLSKPVTIPEGGLYVGFSLKVRAADNDWERHPVVVSRNMGNAGLKSCLFYDAESETWKDLSDEYVLALQVAVSGGHLPANAAVGDQFFDIITTPSAPTEISIPVRATGTKPVNSIDAQLLVNDEPAGEVFHHEFSAPVTNFSAQQLNFTVNAPSQSGNANCALRIEKVNGVENNHADKAPHAGSVVVLSRQGYRRSVMEEFTGTWCSWCPRGMAGIQLVSEAYPDRFVPIAIHRSGNHPDPMYLSDYDAVRGDWDSFPGAVINRELETDPYNGIGSMGIVDVVGSTLQQLCPADIDLAAQWTDDSRASLQVTATTTFHYSTQRADFALAFVVLHNALTGTGAEWDQVNIYSGRTDWAEQPGMKPYTDGPSKLTGFAYHHVPIAVEGIARGISGSICSPLVDGEAQNFTIAINLAGNPLLQNADSVYAAALLIYRPTGQIVTAAQTLTMGERALGIERMEHADSNRSTMIFTLDGRRQTALVKGVNIVRTSDGKVKKIYNR